MELSQVQIQPLRARAQKGSWDAVPWDVLHSAAQLGQGWQEAWGRRASGKGNASHHSWQPSIYCSCFPALTILHVRNWFQKEAPSSKLKRTPPANARHKHLHKGHVPQILGSQHQLRHPNSS